MTDNESLEHLWSRIEVEAELSRQLTPEEVATAKRWFFAGALCMVPACRADRPACARHRGSAREMESRGPAVLGSEPREWGTRH